MVVAAREDVMCMQCPEEMQSLRAASEQIRGVFFFFFFLNCVLYSDARPLHHRQLGLGHNLRKLSILHHFRDNIETTQQFTLEEDHGESRPVDMGLEPLSNVIIFQDIERVVCNSLISQKCDQFPNKQKSTGVRT